MRSGLFYEATSENSIDLDEVANQQYLHTLIIFLDRMVAPNHGPPTLIGVRYKSP